MQIYLKVCCGTLVLLLAFGCERPGNQVFAPEIISTQMAMREAVDPALQAKLQELRLAYRDELGIVVDVMKTRYQQGASNIDELIQVQMAFVQADLATTSNPLERVKKLETLLKQFREVESFQELRNKSGQGRIDEWHKSKAARIYGEIMLLEERVRQQNAPAEGF